MNKKKKNKQQKKAPGLFEFIKCARDTTFVGLSQAKENAEVYVQWDEPSLNDYTNYEASIEISPHDFNQSFDIGKHSIVYMATAPNLEYSAVCQFSLAIIGLHCTNTHTHTDKINA